MQPLCDVKDENKPNKMEVSDMTGDWQCLFNLKCQSPHREVHVFNKC